MELSWVTDRNPGVTKGAGHVKAKYTWVVTRDSSLGDSSNVVGRIGPHGAEGRLPFDVVIRRGMKFRLRNAQGRAEFIGYVFGEYSGPEPLEDFGREYGCTAIEYERDGEWVSLN